MTKQPTTSIVLDKYLKSNQKYNVKLRIIYDRKPRYYTTGIDLTKEDFFNLDKDRKLKKVRLALNEFETTARSIIACVQPFSLDAFDRKLVNRSSDGSDVYRIFNEQIQHMIAHDRIGNAKAYEGAMKSLKKYCEVLRFEQITPAFLLEFQRWHMQRGNSISTVGIHLRQLRAIYNIAINEGIVQSSALPFGRNRFIIPKGQNTKKALTNEDLALMFDYVGKTAPEKRSLDLWKFGYYSGGMNLVDIAGLKFSNIEENSIYYIRKKTQRTKASTEYISIQLSEETKTIIEKWGSKLRDKNDYIFPILRKGDSAAVDVYRVTEFRRHMNEHTKRIAKSLGINKNVTTYAARHSFATVLYRRGLSVGKIRQMLGHGNVAITQNYLDDFDIDSMKGVHDLLKPIYPLEVV